MIKKFKTKTIRVTVRNLNAPRITRITRKKAQTRKKRVVLVVRKAAAFLLIISVNWNGLSAVLDTSAYFNDSRGLNGNVFAASSLDIGLATSTDFSAPIVPGTVATSSIEVLNLGTLDFYYRIATATTTGDLCERIDLTAAAVAATSTNPAKTDNLVGFSFDAGNFNLVGGSWEFVANITPGFATSRGEYCNFYIIFNGAQNASSTFGFSDTEAKNWILTSEDGDAASTSSEPFVGIKSMEITAATNTAATIDNGTTTENTLNTEDAGTEADQAPQTDDVSAKDATPPIPQISLGELIDDLGMPKTIPDETIPASRESTDTIPQITLDELADDLGITEASAESTPVDAPAPTAADVPVTIAVPATDPASDNAAVPTN